MKSNLDILIENHVPPTLYSLCESICYTNNTPCRITKLAENTRATIFDFDYPLSQKINKEQFEINIINHFLMRRIGTETFTAFQLMLSNKLNEIMPYYNKLFDAFEDWSLFNDGEVTERTTNSETETKTDNYSNTTSENISDRRYSDMPDNRLDDIKDGKYITDYNLDKNTAGSDNVSVGNASGKSSDTEKITRTPGDKMNIYKEFFNNHKSIFTKLYKELDVCFYGLYE